MDLSRYIKKSDTRAANKPAVARRCMQCGKGLEDDGTHFYRQRFCSLTCKERYVGRPLDY